MKNSTYYISGQDRSYFEPELTILAEKRIKTARELMNNISCAKNRASERAIPNLIHRYEKAEESLKWWTAILEEK